MADGQSEILNGSPQAPDPALVAYRVFNQAHDAMDNWPGEIPEHVSETAHLAYKALIATKATSAAGVVAQLQGHLRWCDELGNEEYDERCRIVTDLARFVVNFGEPVTANAKSESLRRIATDLETAVGKIDALTALLGRLADDGGDDALTLFSLMYSTRAIHDEAKDVFGR